MSARDVEFALAMGELQPEPVGRETMVSAMSSASSFDTNSFSDLARYLRN